MFQVGDKVIVKARARRPQKWAPHGSMDKYMGTVQEIEKIFPSGHVYLKGCQSSCGNNWFFELNDLMPLPEIRDQIKIRSWEDMEEQYGLDECGDIDPDGNNFMFLQDMRYLCSKTHAIEGIEFNADIPTRFYIDDWYIEPYMIERVIKKEDKEVDKFTKKDLKDGMVVEYRDTQKRLVIGNRLLGRDFYLSFESLDDDLLCPIDRDLDIMKIYISRNTAGNLIYLLEDPENLELIWERKEPKEIPASEAMKILREKFGCEVKLVEDK